MIGWLKVRETSAVAEARRRARRTANAMGLHSTKVEHAAIVATEIAQNILRHGGGGQILVEIFGAPALERLHIVGHDEGPGIGRVDRMMRDGETTKGSAGTGLGAIKRLSDRLDIFSEPGRTVVAAEFRRQTIRHADPVDHAGFKLAFPGERRCGDIVAARSSHDECFYFIADGLGHGVKAAGAAAAAKKSFLAAKGDDPAEILLQVGNALQDTRGAVGAVVALDRSHGRLRYAGIGNISTLIVQGKTVRRLVVRDGLLGGRLTTPHQETVELEKNAILVMHSDGLNTLRSLDTQATLLQRSAPVIAADLMANNLRGRDDASIIVSRVSQARTL